MSDMIRRKKTVPVQARRVEADPRILPSTVKIPGTAASQQSPGVTQNIIYVNMPAAAASPPPSEPKEIHMHTHVHQYPSRRRPGRNQTSFLGTLAFVLSGVAFGACYAPQVSWLAAPIAILAFGCAIIALLGALVSSRVGRGMPMVGLIASIAAYGFWMVRTGQGPVPRFVSENLAKLTAPATANPPVAPTVPPSTPKVASPAPPAQPPTKDHSIFGDGGNWGNSPAKPAETAPPPAASDAPAALTIDAAKTNLETARAAAAKKIGVDYAAVKTAATDARNDYEQLRSTSTPGSAEVQAAGRRYLSAASDLTDLQKKLDSDSAVAAAQLALKNVK